MKTKIVTVMLLCVTSVLVVGCANQPSARPTVERADIVYADIEVDSTETLRQIATNNEMLEAAP